MAKCSQTDKRKFRTKLDADLDILRIQNNFRRHRRQSQDIRPEPIRSYRCEFCGAWHQTGQKERGTRVD